jgi:hypothetical protein
MGRGVVIGRIHGRKDHVGHAGTAEEVHHLFVHRLEISAVLRFCYELPIALATVAALVCCSNFDWPLISRRLKESLWDPVTPSIGGGPRFSARGGHDGLAAVFFVGLRALHEALN